MKKETYGLVWAISLIICGLSGLLVGITGIFGIDIPDMIMRVVGVIDLIAVAALAFTTVIRLKNRDK